MPRVNVPVTTITRAGVAPAAEVNGDAAQNHVLSNDGRTFLLVRNANGSSTARTLTVIIQGAIDGFAPAPRTYSIAAGASRYIGPFDTVAYGSLMQINVDNAELKLSAYNY
ncbi:hypothetical protein [Micromonospora tulbaghiae]|uniref:hypothetical protein n=1 Tax=Micromonospora tulbaghiae TaxID=479978 RepID=UPI003404DDD7